MRPHWHALQTAAAPHPSLSPYASLRGEGEWALCFVSDDRKSPEFRAVPLIPSPRRSRCCERGEARVRDGGRRGVCQAAASDSGAAHA
jgi:hypothetical protein